MTAPASAELGSRHDWRDPRGKLIRKPGRLSIAIAAYANHLHTEAGGKPDFGACITSLMDFRLSVQHQRLLSNQSPLFLWLIDFVGGVIPLAELRIASENSRQFDHIVASMMIDRLITVPAEDNSVVVLTERGKRLAEEGIAR